MCYSEFTDIIPVIDAMDADVITFEASRSDLQILDSLKANNFKTEVGPGAIGMWWAGCRDGNAFRSASRLASELSAISNSGSGQGLHLFETYQRSSRNVADVERQFNDTIACIRSMVEMVPATRASIFCYLGTYYFPGDWSALTSPYADHRVLLDMWAWRLATDPSLADMLAGFGSGDYNFTDEEMVRWITAILKHLVRKYRFGLW